MRKFTFFMILAVFVSNSLAQYQMSLQNDLQTSPSTYEFDVFIRSTSGTINLTSYGLVFSFNVSIIGTGFLTFSYLSGTSDLSNLPNINTGIFIDGLSQNLATGSNPGSDSITTTDVRVGRFRISNSVAFLTQTPNINWDFSGSIVTEVNVNSSDVTNPSNHSNSLTNPQLPVELSSFTASLNQNVVNLKWQTKTEVNNYGFEIERSTLNPQSAVHKAQFEKVGFVEGYGNSNSPKEYSFTDKNPSGGSKFLYRLKQIDSDGKFTYSDEVELEFVPAKFELFQNYPNPFNPSTNIKFAVPKAGNITLSIYSILGEKVKDLAAGFYEPGIYNIEFSGKELGSGTYIYRLQGENFVQVKKMILLK